MSDSDRAKPATAPGGDGRLGFAYALCAYMLWGILPVYLKAMDHVPALEVVTHRIVWSVPVAGLLLLWLGRTSDIGRALRSPRTIAMAVLSAALISLNWGIYIWAISVDRTVETALGYYINPLLSVLLGAILLGERLSPLQKTAIALAAVAVAILTWDAGGLPWISLTLSLSWGCYALLKKTLPIGPAQGFFLEVLVLLPVGLALLAYFAVSGAGHFVADDWKDTALLLGCGPVTAIPLILYANGAKLLRLSTIGIMQYISPTLIFLIAVFVFGEPVGNVRLAAFILIWIALALYSLSMFRGRSNPDLKATP